jgi:trk system potassium uptake protein TrkA
MIDQTLSDLNLRKRYGINILTIKRQKNSDSDDAEDQEYHSVGIPDANTEIKSGDRLVLMGHKNDCEKIVDMD